MESQPYPLCFVAPIALIGPATSGFSTASIIQAGVSTGANYVVEKSTGKTIGQHALDAIHNDVLVHTYLPTVRKPLVVAP